MTEDFYDLLEIPSDAPQDEVKDAYREQVRVYHPDHNDDDRARAQFTAVKKAYDILGDPVERRAYDRLGHETYVAKRTSGLPSPDVWRSKSDTSSESDDAVEADADADDSGTTFSYSDEESTASASSASASKSKAKATAGATAGTTTGGTASASTSASSATGTGTGGTTGTGTGTRDATGTGTSSGTTRTTATGSTDGGTAHRTARSHGGRSSNDGRFGDNAVVRWWRRQNFSLPLIWLSVLIYLGGLVHFGLENGAALEDLATELTAIGADPAGLWETLSSSRHGVETSLEYLTAFELLAPPLEGPLWYAALAGVVGLTVVGLLGARAAGDRELTEPISIDETIVLALALTASTVLVGGPLLAGAVLMPVLFTVIVRHTRRGRGWKPSYLYIAPVLAPLVGLGLAAADVATLPIELVAFAILPLVGGLGLPLRATIRKRFGR